MGRVELAKTILILYEWGKNQFSVIELPNNSENENVQSNRINTL